MLFLGILLVYISLVDGCGISTHTEIVWRALDKLRSVQYKYNHTRTIVDILERNPDALQAGGPFPDAFYNSLCYQGRYHSESEDTHWGLFLQVSLEYIRTEYPSLDQRSEKIIAFLFGIISHQVADITWHSLQGLKQGFIPALAALNFRGDFNAAHDFADVAGDMIGVYEWNVQL
ncbi:phosphatidylinositol-glycan-specific phospholipase D [Eurytemora carolleeae]|uniref:phosphatidylinositol-glycan-specific phospholipase D n=1 Tax=Eurytemora carolleeae TaxID=1294199 RepID=UPI000C75A708|nr:phosphatidylinositol-glycan-specific phospholipase D [Eurytemora carolleeae]|eukprot:XP_023343411.1 phosphatidylinositol-glycan-specific phospholipase D-like [Eurytemora affinis]